MKRVAVWICNGTPNVNKNYTHSWQIWGMICICIAQQPWSWNSLHDQHRSLRNNVHVRECTTHYKRARWNFTPKCRYMPRMKTILIKECSFVSGLNTRYARMKSSWAKLCGLKKKHISWMVEWISIIMCIWSHKIHTFMWIRRQIYQTHCLLWTVVQSFNWNVLFWENSTSTCSGHPFYLPFISSMKMRHFIFNKMAHQTATTCSRWFLARGFFYPEDGGDTFLRNVGPFHRIYTAPRPRRRHFHSHRCENLKSYTIMCFFS
jgi:hypothetical protein